MSQFNGDSRRCYRTDQRKSKFKVRREPFVFEGIASFTKLLDNILKIALDEMRKHETIVQRSLPVDQLAPVWLFPELGDQRSDQQLLSQAHARMRRHFKGPQFDQPQPGGGV